MKRKFLVILPAALTVLVLSGISHWATPAESGGTAHFTLGPKAMDKDQEPAEDQFQLGASIAFGQNDWPVKLVVDVMASSGDGSEAGLYSGYYYIYNLEVDVDVKTMEIGFGVQKAWSAGKIHPFVGGGVEWFRGDVKATVRSGGFSVTAIDDSDSGFGLWVGGGVYWQLGQKFNLGVNVRYNDAEITIDTPIGSKDANASGVHLGLLLGWTF